MTFINFEIKLKTININWSKLKLFHRTNRLEIIEVWSNYLNNVEWNNLELNNDFQ